VAFTSSGLYVATHRDALKNAIALDLTAATHKVAMYTNTLTPNFDADPSSYSATNEVSGTGYTAGGTTVSSPTLTGSSGSLTFDAADASWSSSTISSARGAIVYADALSPKANIVAITFGGDYSTVSGTFTIQWSASGIYVIDLTP
jgi:hypothetical protein